MKKILIAVISAFILSFPVSGEDWQALQKKANDEYRSHNWKDAFELYKKILLAHEASPYNYRNAVRCLSEAGLQNEFDGFFTVMAEKYAEKPEMAIFIAQSKMQMNNYGYIIAGKFVRGPHRGGGERVSCLERDRVEALRLLFGVAEKRRNENFYNVLKDILMWGRERDRAWKLQYLTDISKLPDYEKLTYNYWRYRPQGAPVGPDGEPVFYHVPESFEAASSDGERWRWAMDKLIKDEKNSKVFRLMTKKRVADFFKSQFGVETIAYHMRDKIQAVQTGPYALHLLKDDETIATLATGVRKIKLPADCNYLAMYKDLINTECSSDGLKALAEIYRNRRQYVKAADMLRELVRISRSRKQEYIDQLKQICGNWVQLLDCETFPAGARPTVNLKFRNTKKISCKLTKVKIKAFIEDIKKKFQDAQSRTQMFKLGYQPRQVGNWLLDTHRERYLGELTAEWEKDLKPPAGHFDETIPLLLPVSEAGVYFLEITAEDGNSSRIIVWLSNTAILERDANGGKLYIVTDALTGKALDFCRMKFFGYKSEYIRDKSRRLSPQERYKFTFDEFYAQTDANGMVFVEAPKFKRGTQYMLEAEVGEHSGVLGFSGFYCRRYSVQKMNRMQRIYGITDRPVYKPGQTVNFNYWLRVVGYDRDDYIDNFSGRTVKMTVRSPRRIILEKEFRTDNFGAFNSSFKLPEDADLGRYSVYLHGLGGHLSFRVEEYRKPEYEVKVAMPEKPLMLGDEIPVTVKAVYLFGAPVADAEVKYKVHRTSKSDFAGPVYKWDWLYGGNVWSFSSSCFYGGSRVNPVELVADNVGRTDAEGKLTFTIDTSLAKALFGDMDSEYRITAEVTDQSRYTETGQGTVIAACKPFRVFCDTDKGFYRTGDVVNLTVTALGANGEKISGSYEAGLYKITYDEQKSPVETKVKSWSGKKEDEDIKIQFRPDKVGHYIAKVKLTDAKNNSGSADVIIRVIGKGKADTGRMTSLPLELVADQKTYVPGDTASLMINTAEADQNVYLFVRPAAAGMMNYARLLKLNSGYTVRELKISRSDMPNIFVEAVAVRNGKAYSVVKQIIVPPEKKILTIELKTPENKYKPGSKCPLKIKICDSDGQPVVGDVVLTVYDKALDIINGGGNIPEINSFFWKWTRHWYSRLRSSLDKDFRNVLKRNEKFMLPLGIFGNLPSPGRDAEFFGEANGAMVMSERSTKMKALSSPMADVEGGAPPKEAAVVIRKNFADSILWKVELKTDEQGMAELPLPLPDNLTSWKIRAWAMTDKCSVGQGETEVIVSKDYLVRLILPRFLNTGDTATLSAIIMNQGDKAGEASASLEIPEDCLRLLDKAEQKVKITANGEQRLDWRVRAFNAGEATVTVKSFFGKDSDAVELKLPVAVKGIDKQVASSGVIRSDKEGAAVAVEIPEKLRKGSAKLTINFSPSIAMAMVDALPYLINTDDKDIFSTINRLIPALITRNTLKKLNIDLAEIEKSRTNLNPVELGDKKERAPQWKRFKNNPVFSKTELEAIVAKELKTIAGMQNRDGGWGWFSAFYENSEVYTTVRTVRALLLAKNNGVAIESKMLTNGINWLKIWQARRITDIKEGRSSVSNIDALVFDTLVKTGNKSDFMLETLYNERSKLTLNGVVLLASASYRINDKEKLQLLLKNIEQFAVEDAENQTAYLRIPEAYYWWCWYGRDIDTQAEYLKLLAKVDPKGKRASYLAKYILINRKHATYWTSVVDTGLCVEALCDFVINSGEAKPEMELEVLYDGQSLSKIDINPKNMFAIDNSIEVPAEQLTSGKHTVSIQRQGKGTVYFNTYTSYFTMENPIKAAGLDLKVKRQYFKLLPVKAEEKARGSRGQALEVNIEKYKREAIKNYTEISSGDLIEIEFTIESKNDYEYIVINDGKPAGFEPINILSGYTQNSLGAFVEARNTMTRFYVRRLARGRHSMSYRMRAVTPGKFSALPVIATGVYAPELRCNSNDFNVIIK